MTLCWIWEVNCDPTAIASWIQALGSMLAIFAAFLVASLQAKNAIRISQDQILQQHKNALIQQKSIQDEQCYLKTEMFISQVIQVELIATDIGVAIDEGINSLDFTTLDLEWIIKSLNSIDRFNLPHPMLCFYVEQLVQAVKFLLSSGKLTNDLKSIHLDMIQDQNSLSIVCYKHLIETVDGAYEYAFKMLNKIDRESEYFPGNKHDFYVADKYYHWVARDLS